MIAEPPSSNTSKPASSIRLRDVFTFLMFGSTFIFTILILSWKLPENGDLFAQESNLSSSELKELVNSNPGMYKSTFDKFQSDVLDVEIMKIGSRSLFPKSLRNAEGIVDFPDLRSFPFHLEIVKDYKKRIEKRMIYSQMKTSPARGRIFVSVPAYRDEKCPNTLKFMFEKADDPSRIFAGVCDQMNFDDDQPCRAPKEFEKQVRYVRVPHYLSRGPTLARYLVSKLWDGEEFFFMIDSHSDFSQGWDTILINMMRNLHDKAIVTHYPVGENRLLGKNEYNHLPWICKATFEAHAPHNFFIQECEDCRPENRPGRIACPSVFLGAGFTFGSAQMIWDAPYDRYLEWFFQGEEVLMASRLWTAGWELYAPTTNVISHVYGYHNHSVYSEVKKERSNSAALNRARYLMGYKYKEVDANGVERIVPEPYPTGRDQELEDLGMGTVRTIEEYLEFAGLDWINHQHTHRCKMRYDWERKKWFPAR
jgi:hypothetical protein